MEVNRRFGSNSFIVEIFLNLRVFYDTFQSTFYEHNCIFYNGEKLLTEFYPNDRQQSNVNINYPFRRFQIMKHKHIPLFHYKRVSICTLSYSKYFLSSFQQQKYAVNDDLRRSALTVSWLEQTFSRSCNVCEIKEYIAKRIESWVGLRWMW